MHFAYFSKNLTKTILLFMLHKLFLFPVPRSIIQVRNISSTSLLVEWQDRWSQELRQFQIIYNRTTNQPSQNITVNASQQSVELHDLGFFTWYCVRVFVSRQGVEQKSPCVYARTGQDGEWSVNLYTHAWRKKKMALWGKTPIWIGRGCSSSVQGRKSRILASLRVVKTDVKYFICQGVL